MGVYPKWGGRGKWAPATPRLVAGQQPRDQLLHRRDEAVAVEGVAGEAVGVVAREHQLELDVVGMADRLQRLLDTEAARIRLLSGAAGLVLGPVGELAGG